MNNALPTLQETFAKLRGELRIGLALNVGDAAIVALEHLPRARFDAIMAMEGTKRVILSRNRALDLRLSHDPSSDVTLELPADFRYETLLALADPAMDMDYPGKGPLAQATPHPQMSAILDFCRSARTLPAVLVAPTPISGASEFIFDRDTPATLIRPVSRARVPLEIAGATQVQVYRALDIDDEHYAIIVGQLSEGPPIVRVHSACFTGDCLGSLKCDCGPQLHAALAELRAQGGILLYLSQEGRGIGMANKMRAYKLQEQGFDTVDANQKLGFDDDHREFGIAAEILTHLKRTSIRLLTNNPRKIDLLTAAGITITERIPLQTQPRPENEEYLATKAKRSGHLL